MTKCKWFKFYYSDFLEGIHGMCGTEIAVYIIVICELYKHEGSCPRDDARMADLCIVRQVEFTKFMDRLIAKGKIDSYAGRLTNKRVTQEIESRLKIALEKAGKRELTKHQRDIGKTSTKHQQPGKLNTINGYDTHVPQVSVLEIREDKKERTLEVSTLHPALPPLAVGAAEDRAERSKRALEEFEKRRAERATKKPTYLRGGPAH